MLDDHWSTVCPVRRSSSRRDRSPGVHCGSLAFTRSLRSRPSKLRRRDRRHYVSQGRLAAHQEGARIVLGDINATPWSDALKRLGRRGRAAELDEGTRDPGIVAGIPRPAWGADRSVPLVSGARGHRARHWANVRLDSSLRLGHRRSRGPVSRIGWWHGRLDPRLGVIVLAASTLRGEGSLRGR